MWRVSLLIMLSFLVCGTALAQTAEAGRTKPGSHQSGWMTAGEMRAELFGVDLRGVTEPGSVPWRECIGQDGRTLYQIGSGTEERGVMWVTDEAQACFQYEDGGGGCFRALRQGSGYLFSSGQGGIVFAATDVRRGVETCVREDLVG